MVKVIKEAVFSILSALLLIGGVGVVVIGAVSGFGRNSFVAKVLEVAVGLVAVSLGLYCSYLAHNKRWEGTVSDILEVILLSWWR